MPVHFHRLPHVWAIGRPIFITWRLRGSLPRHRYFPAWAADHGAAFAAMDRLLDIAAAGPAFLAQPPLATMIVEALYFNELQLRQYTLHAYVAMPNHIHLLLTPLQPLPRLTRSLKTITASRANAALERKGLPFWQAESYDHAVRDTAEFGRIQRYIEWNPVRASLVKRPQDYPWSSAASGAGPRPAGRPPAGPG